MPSDTVFVRITFEPFISVETMYDAESAIEISLINENVDVAFDTLPNISVPSSSSVFVRSSMPCKPVSTYAHSVHTQFESNVCFPLSETTSCPHVDACQ